MYGLLVIHLEHLYRVYLSGGTVPMPGMQSVIPEVADDQARIKAALKREFKVAECPPAASLLPHSSALKDRQVLIRWQKPWHLATIIGAAKSDAQLMKFMNDNVAPTHRVLYASDNIEGDAYLAASSYYVEGAISCMGTWLLLDKLPLESDVHPRLVRNPQRQQSTGRPGKGKRHKAASGPTSDVHAKRVRTAKGAVRPASKKSTVSSPSPAKATSPASAGKRRKTS